MTSRPTLHGPRLVLTLALAGGGLLGSGAVLAQEPALGSPGQTIYRARCASCHDAEAGSPEATRAPSRAALRERSRDAIVAALSTGGSMAPMATGITAVEKAAIAAFLSPIASPPPDPTLGRCATQPAALPDPSKLPRWNGWGNDPTNARFQPAAAAGLTTRSVPKLTLKWAFGIPRWHCHDGQPTVFAGRLFFGSENGTVYALDADDRLHVLAVQGRWRRPERGERRADCRNAAGDVRGVLRRLQRQRPRGRCAHRRADLVAEGRQSCVARITGGPTLVDGRLYVPVSSLEELPGARPNYQCCTFRGSIVAIDANTGKQMWKTYTIPEAPTMAGKNAAGTHALEAGRRRGLGRADR